jgi:hypothetical protein
MAWASSTVQTIGSMQARFPDGIETDYIDPVLGRSLTEHLKTYWLIREMHGYKEGYEAARVKESLDSEKFTEKDWLAIAEVCGFKRSWAYRQMEE